MSTSQIALLRERLDNLNTEADDYIEKLASCVRDLRVLCSYPSPVVKDADSMTHALHALKSVASAYGSVGLKERCDAVIRTPTDGTALYRLGYELIEEGMPLVAAAFLEKAVEYRPTPLILSELVAALEYRGLNAEAVKVLERHEYIRELDFMCSYLFVYNLINSMRIDDAAAYIETCRRLVESDSDRYMLNNLEAMISRANALKHNLPEALGNKDLRGWHYVLNSGLLLHTSPFGRDVMSGRYCVINDHPALAAEGICKLKVALDALGLSEAIGTRIVYAPDANSSILAHATAKIFTAQYGKDFTTVPMSEEVGEQPALFIAHSLNNVRSVDFLIKMKTRRPGQVLWSHGTDWHDGKIYTPDFTTFLYERLSGLCEPEMEKIYESLHTKEEEEGEEAEDGDSKADEVLFESTQNSLVSSIVKEAETYKSGSREPEDDEEKPEVLTTFLSSLGEVENPLNRAGALCTSGPRGNFRDNSPVKSNSFLY